MASPIRTEDNNAPVRHVTADTVMRISVGYWQHIYWNV